MNRARQMRLDNGAGVIDTADGAGISTRTLNKIENGENVHAASLDRLARFYGIRPSELLAPAVFETNGEAA